MIDFIFGTIFGALIVVAYFNFRGSPTPKAPPSLDLETMVEAVRGLITTGVPKVEDFFAPIEQRIEAAMSKAGDDIVAKLNKATTDVTTAITAAAEAEKTDHAADLTNIEQAADALVAAIPAQPAA